MDITMKARHVEISGALENYQQLTEFIDRLFAAGAALWPHEAAAFAEDSAAGDDAQEEPPPRKKRVVKNPNGVGDPKPGSFDAEVLTVWREGVTDRDKIAQVLDKPVQSISLALGRLRSRGAIEA